MAEAHSAKLWVDKYRPRSFDELELNTQLSERLKQLVFALVYLNL